MTPERKAYFTKCSEREKLLHCWINDKKAELKHLKRMCKVNLEDIAKRNLRESKWLLTMYRHELARLKGMDRVVVPRKAYIGAWGDKGGLCKCGKHITDVHNYCPWCGRRILWEKVNYE